MTKLKRCPFCGGEAEIIRYGLNKKSMLYTPHCKNEYCVVIVAVLRGFGVI